MLPLLCAPHPTAQECSEPITFNRSAPLPFSLVGPLNKQKVWNVLGLLPVCPTFPVLFKAIIRQQRAVEFFPFAFHEWEEDQSSSVCGGLEGVATNVG